MMSKVNTACKSLAAGSRKIVLENPVKQQVQSTNNNKRSKSNEVLVIDNRGTTFEVVVKTKGRKSGSTMVSSKQASSTASKVTEDGRANEWSKTFRDQNRPAIKQGVQQLAAQMQSSKRTRHENSERKEIKTMVGTHESRRIARQDNRIFNELPVKQAAKISLEHVKTAPNSAVPSTTTIASSTETVELNDRGVQYGGIFDRSNDRFSAFNPVRTIAFLMKEMEGLVRDERSSKILTEMEHALFRIPMEIGKPAPVLDAETAKLAESSAKIESTCAAQREEIETLLQQVNKQAAMLEEAKQREMNLESELKQMKMELNDAQKSTAANRRTISQLQQENKSIEGKEKLMTELRRELNEQIELAEQRYMEGQYLKLEKEKFMTLSSYKDSMLVEQRTALKELQNYISEQLIGIREAGKDALGDYQSSMVHDGAACSSPTSSCSINSIVPASCPELSEMSLSTVDYFGNSVLPTNKPPSKSQLPSSCFNGCLDDSETGRLCDKTQLEFISLPGGETSHAISSSHRKDEEGNEFAPPRKQYAYDNDTTTIHLPIVLELDKKKVEPPSGVGKVEGFRSAPNLGERNARDSLPGVNGDIKDSRPKSKTRKSSSAEKRRSGDAKSLSNPEEAKRAGAGRASGEPASIKQQFDMMFEDIRQQSKLPVHVPSPPHDYSPQDWSDSSFPTISGISESNII